MSAQPQDVRLNFLGDARLPRELIVSSSSIGYLCAAVYARKRPPGAIRTIAYAHTRLAECRIEVGFAPGEYYLCVGDASFGLTRAEVAAIHDAFAPMGLASKFTP